MSLTSKVQEYDVLVDATELENILLGLKNTMYDWVDKK